MNEIIIRKEFQISDESKAKVMGLLRENMPPSVVDREARSAVLRIIDCDWDMPGNGERIVFDHQQLSNSPIEALEEALSILEAYSQPASDDELDVMLTALQIKSPQKEMSDAEKRLQNGLYKRELSLWPYDAVKASLSMNWKWFPSTYQLEKNMLRRCGGRVSMKEQIEKIIINGTQRGKMKSLHFLDVLNKYRL